MPLCPYSEAREDPTASIKEAISALDDEGVIVRSHGAAAEASRRDKYRERRWLGSEQGARSWDLPCSRAKGSGIEWTQDYTQAQDKGCTCISTALLTLSINALATHFKIPHRYMGQVIKTNRNQSLKGHSANFTREVQCTNHMKHYSACETCCVMSSVVMERAFQSLIKKK